MIVIFFLITFALSTELSRCYSIVFMNACALSLLSRGRRVLLVTLSLLALGLSSWAQSLSGVVADPSGEPIPFANIVVLALPDSTFVRGTVSDDEGHFVLHQLRQGQLVQASMLGYRPTVLTYTGQTAVTLTLEEASVLLGEVVATASLPKTILKGEGMNTTVAGTVLEKTATIDQMLGLIPGLTAQSGSVEVLGRGTPEIYINGRPMRNSMELERLQPDQIQEVEVITNPGARYGAAVKCVIRITTKKIVGDGLSVDSKTTGTVNEKGRLGGTQRLQLYYRKDRWELGVYGYGSYSRTPDDKQIHQLTYSEGHRWDQYSDIVQEYTQGYVYSDLSLSYALNPTSSIGASISYQHTPDQVWAVSDMEGSFYHNGEEKERSHSHMEFCNWAQNVQSNVYYVGKIGNVKIDFNTDFYQNERHNRDRNDETFVEGDSNSSTRSVDSQRDIHNRLLASKLVLSLPVASGSLAFGGEYTYTDRKNHYAVLPTGIVDDDDSNFTESMSSLFGDYSRTFGPLFVQAGLRYEYNDFDYFEKGTRIPEQSKTYGNLFPSLALSMPVGQTQMQLGYATDIARPSYGNLRSGVQYDNRYTYETGNPLLVPTISRNVSYGLSWRWVTLSAMYQHVVDDISQLTMPYKGDPEKMLLKPINMPAYDNVRTILSLSPRFGIWQPRLTMSLYKQWYPMETHEGRRLERPLGDFALANTFDTKWLTLFLTLYARTTGDMTNVNIPQGSFRTDLSLYKGFLDDRLTLQLSVYDLFGTGDSKFFMYSGPNSAAYFDNYSTSSVTLTIRYKFNTAKSKYRGTGAGEAQKDRL